VSGRPAALRRTSRRLRSSRELQLVGRRLPVPGLLPIIALPIPYSSSGSCYDQHDLVAVNTASLPAPASSGSNDPPSPCLVLHCISTSIRRRGPSWPAANMRLRGLQSGRSVARVVKKSTMTTTPSTCCTASPQPSRCAGSCPTAPLLTSIRVLQVGGHGAALQVRCLCQCQQH
jgi:hypothetical protein